MLKINHIGSHTTIPGWPEHGTIAGLLDALKRWPLDPSLNLSTDPHFDPHPQRAPYRGPALTCGWFHYSVERGCTVYHYGKPRHPEAPDAVSYLGNFVGYSFAFNLDTDDPQLIATLDAAIADNLERNKQT